MDPGPIPTLTASAPASASIRAASPVATLPTTISTSLKQFFVSRSLSITKREWPCAVSIIKASAPACTNASIRCIVSSVTPTPAATRNRPFASLQAIGLSLALVISLYVISPTNFPSLSITGSFSILFSFKIRAAPCRSVC